jgi:flagellar biosynthesis/type III secretory pathway protein FliH
VARWEKFAPNDLEVQMSLTRKRRKELTKLRASAEQLWSHQQEVLDRANSVAREAGRQVGYLTREEVAPRVRDGYSQYLQPRVDATRQFATDANSTIEKTVLPAVGTVLGSVLTIGDIAKDKRVQAAIDRLNRGKVVVPTKSGPGVGTYLAVAAGILAAAGVAYAVWQTFRADDELWVADEEPTATTAE